MNRIALTLTFLTLCSCQNFSVFLFNKPNPAETVIQPIAEQSLGLRLTVQGNNIEARFSNSGDKICFVSNNRLNHKNRQLYEYTISNFSERRVSFSDGDIFQPIYRIHDAEIIYSSNTDEIKERPLLFYPEKYQEYIPKDLYTTDASGKKIERLVQLEGEQFAPEMAPGNRDEITFISRNAERVLIAKKNLRTKSTTDIKVLSTKSVKQSLLHPSGQFYWLAESKLHFGNIGVEDLIINVNQPISEIHWASVDKNTLMILTAENGNSMLSILKLKQKCQAQVLKLPKKITGFDYSFKTEKLLLTLQEDERSNLYLRELKASELEAFSCDPIPATAPPAK